MLSLTWKSWKAMRSYHDPVSLILHTISELFYFHSLITCHFSILTTVRTYVILRIFVTFNHGKSFPQSSLWLTLMVVIFLKFYFWNALSEPMASGYLNSSFPSFFPNKILTNLGSKDGEKYWESFPMKSFWVEDFKEF